MEFVGLRRRKLFRLVGLMLCEDGEMSMKNVDIQGDQCSLYACPRCSIFTLLLVMFSCLSVAFVSNGRLLYA